MYISDRFFFIFSLFITIRIFGQEKRRGGGEKETELFITVSERNSQDTNARKGDDRRRLEMESN